jgi:hypothetical protein
VRGKRGAHPLGEDGAAAERDHCLVPLPPGLGEELADEPLLVDAEGVLPVELELAGDGVPEAGFEQAVGVEHVGAELGGDRGGGGGLAGAHEADEDEGAG